MARCPAPWHLTAVEVARQFHEHGCNLIDVSAGQTHPEANPIYGRMFQTPFSDRIRNELRNVATIAVGNSQTWDQVNTIVVSGRADLCAGAAASLRSVLHAARRRRAGLASAGALARAVSGGLSVGDFVAGELGKPVARGDGSGE